MPPATLLPWSRQRLDDASGPLGPGVRAAGRWVGLLSWVMVVPISLAALLRMDLSPDGRLGAASWALVLAQLPVLVGLLWNRPRRRAMWATGLVFLLASLAWVPHRDQLHPINWWAPSYWAMGWFAWCVLHASRRQYFLLVGGALALLAVVDAATVARTHHPVTGLALAPIPWFFVPWSLIGLFGYGLLHLGDLADQQAARRITIQHDHESARDALRTRREAERLLHDHVLHALNAVARLDVLSDHQMVVDECRSAGAAVAASGEQEDEQLRVEDLVADDPAVDRVAATVHGHTAPMPAHAARALAAAAHEALANVATHAAARTCQVEASQEEGRWRVVVRDDGRGFDPRKLPAGRLGLRGSVHERLEDSGGQAVVTSSPHRGTTVELVWPALDEEDEQWLQRGDRATRQVLARTVWPGLWSTVTMGLLCGTLVHPAWPMLLMGTVMVVVAVACLRQLRRRALSTPMVAVLVGLSLVAWWLNLALVGRDAQVPYQLWGGWAGGALLSLVVLQLRPRMGATVLAVWGVVQFSTLWAVVGWHRVELVFTSVALTLGEMTVALCALAVARRITRHNESQARMAELMRRSRGRVQARQQLERFWNERATAAALDLLHEVADDPSVLQDPALPGRARLLEATLRDELVLGPGHEELLDGLAALRREGWVVRCSLTPQQACRAGAAMVRLVRQIGPAAHPGQHLTLSANAQHVVALALRPTPEQAAPWHPLVEQAGGSIDLDPDFVRVMLPLPATDPGPRPGPGEGPGELPQSVASDRLDTPCG